MNFDNIVSTQQIGHNTTEPSVTLQKTLFLLVNNEKKLLKLGVNKIGRSADSDICLTSDAVSYEHAHIECEPDDFTLQDLRSTNGTKRNGKTIKPYVYYELVPNTRLVFGDVEAVFYAIDDDQNQVPTSPEEESFSLQIDDDIINGPADESISLLDPNVDVAQIAEIIAPPTESKDVGTPPLLPSGTSSISKWDELMLPAVEFEEENPNDKGGSTTESDFEFHNGDAVDNPPKDQSNLNSKTRMLNIDSSMYELETQKPLSEELVNPIYHVETQNPQIEDGKKENIYDQETQQSEGSNLRLKIHEQDTEIPSLENKQNIYQDETQQTNTSNCTDQSLTDLSDHEVNTKTSDENFKDNTPTKECVNESNLKKKTRKKLKVSNIVDTSDEEEAGKTKHARVKRKQKDHKGNDDDNIKIKQTKNCQEKSSKKKKVNDILISEENDAIVDKNMKNLIDDNDILADSIMSNGNDTNSESFIGMVVGKKRRVLETSSSGDSNASDAESKNEKSANLNLDDRNNKKAPLNSTYDINVQNSIDELYVNEVNVSVTQPEESQVIHEVKCTPVKNKKEEEPESQFILSENEEEDEAFDLLPPESQSLLIHEPADVEASSKNTTNYDVSEMELESVLDGTNIKHTKVLNQNDKNISNIVDNSSSMFSVSETEIQPDFVEDGDFSKVVQSGKPNEKIALPVNEDSSTTSDFEVFEVMRKAAENEERRIEEVLTKKSNNGRKCSPQQPKKNKGIVKKTAKPQKSVKNKKITKNIVASDHDSNSADSDIETYVAEKSNHDTIQANQTEDSAAGAFDDDFFDAVTQEAKPNDTDDSFVPPSQDETDDSFVAPTQKELPDDFFEAATQKVSIGPSETDESFVAPTQNQLLKDFFEAETQKVSKEPSEGNESVDVLTPREVPDDFFEAATQKVSIGPSETDDSLVAPTQNNLPDDFFDAATQKVSIEPSETDESLVAATSKEMSTKKILGGATEKVTTSNKIKGKFPALSIQESDSSDYDFFNAATQKVEEVKKRGISKKAQIQKTKGENLRHCESESSASSEDNEKVSKKKIELRKEKKAPVTTKKVTKNIKDNYKIKDKNIGKKNKMKQDNSPVIPNEEHESSDGDDDFFNAPTQKVGEIKKRNINVSKNIQLKNKNVNGRKECDVNDHESSDLSADDEKITKKKINLKTIKEADKSKSKTDNNNEPKDTHLRDKKRKLPVVEKREITRVRKKNPRYDNSPPKVLNDINSRNQKNLKSKSTPQICENELSQEKKIKIDKNKNITSSTECLLEEIHTATSLRATRGCKGTPKKDPIETNAGMARVDQNVNIADSKNIPTSSKLTSLKNEKSVVQQCVEKEQLKEKHGEQYIESQTGNLLEENHVKPLRNLRCRGKNNSDEKHVDEIDATNSIQKGTLSKTNPLNIDIKDSKSNKKSKQEHVNELLKENTLKSLQPSKCQKIIKKDRKNIIKSQFEEETDSTNSNVQKSSEVTSVNSKESVVEHCEINKQSNKNNLHQLSEENTLISLQASRVRNKKTKNNSAESNILKAGIEKQSRENSPLEENVLKPIQSPRTRGKIKQNDVEPSAMVQIDQKIDTTHFKNKTTPSKTTPVKFEKTESVENLMNFRKKSSALMEEKSSKPLKDTKSRKKIAKDEMLPTLESNVTKNRTLPKVTPVKDVPLKLSTSDQRDQALTVSSLQSSPDPVVVLDRLEDTPPKFINDLIHSSPKNLNLLGSTKAESPDKSSTRYLTSNRSPKHANLLISSETKATNNNNSSTSNTRRSLAQVLSSEDKSRLCEEAKTKKSEKSESVETKANRWKKINELLEDETSKPLKTTKGRKKKTKDEPPLETNVPTADEKNSTKTTPEDKVNSSREEEVQSRLTGKRAKNTREENVPKRGTPAKKRVKKTEEEEESDEPLSPVIIAKPRVGRPRKGTTPVKAAAKRKGPATDEDTMKAPSTPKKMKDIRESGGATRSSPRQRANAACDRVSLKARASRSSNVSLREGRVSRSSSSESANSTTSSERRQKMNTSSAKGPEMKVTFTMVDNVSRYDKLLSCLRGVTTDDALTSDVLVTLKVARSLKFLMFLALGKPIVSVKWLTDSERSMRFMPHAPYILRDSEAEKRYGFSLAQSIARAQETKLLASYSVHVTDSVKPAPDDMKSIVLCAGGTFLATAPASWPPYSIIVTDPADSKQLKKLLAVPGAKPSVVNKEFVLSGILQQKLDFVKHKMKV